MHPAINRLTITINPVNRTREKNEVLMPPNSIDHIPVPSNPSPLPVSLMLERGVYEPALAHLGFRSRFPAR